jgi:hypothetical protein
MGGVLALDLAREKEKSPCWCYAGVPVFGLFCLAVFERSGFLDSILSKFYPVQYKTRPLETEVRLRFGEELFFGWSPHLLTPQVKVALVSSSTAGVPYVIANYNRSSPHKIPYKFDRPEHPKHGLKNWEVARAVLAVPRIFESFTNYKTHRTYQGASVDYINQVLIADRERKVIWPDVCDSAPDVMISIGTGLSHDNEIQPSALHRWLGGTKQRSRSALDPNYCTQFAEKLWNEYHDSAVRNPLDEEKYIRLNGNLDGRLLDFDSADRMNSQRDYIKAIKKSTDLKKLSQRLIASCFYFEVTEQTDQPSLLDDTLKFSGLLHSCVSCFRCG